MPLRIFILLAILSTPANFKSGLYKPESKKELFADCDGGGHGGHGGPGKGRSSSTTKAIIAIASILEDPPVSII